MVVVAVGVAVAAGVVVGVVVAVVVAVGVGVVVVVAVAVAVGVGGAMSQKVLTLHYETSDDGVTDFAEIADILDALALRYEKAGSDNAAAYCFTRADEARKLEEVFQKEKK